MVEVTSEAVFGYHLFFPKQQEFLLHALHSGGKHQVAKCHGRSTLDFSDEIVQ